MKSYSLSGKDHADLATATYSHDTIISSVASIPLRDVIVGAWSTVGELASQALDLQLKLHKEAQEDLQERDARAEDFSLFDAAAAKIAGSIGNDPDADLQAISSLPIHVLTRAFGETWERLSYPAFCSVIAKVRPEPNKPKTTDTDVFSIDIDEWILRNERWLRDNKKRNWGWGLVKYSTQADLIFPGSKLSESHRAVAREPVSDKTILDLKRTKEIRLQPSTDSFVSTFEVLTGGLLNGLKWDNIFVAGGMALAALLCTDHINDVQKYQDSDIDVYIYGLGPIEANEKIQHVYDTWISNLPPNSSPHVIRNSRTITFIANYPIKRIQIVLKLVESPREVLLNFDLDPCSLGFDGRELWLLPRAARALQTGYTVFTMDLVHGHYLGQRRASQESRIFKYADKGFGIRFLPQYIESLPPLTLDTDKITNGVDNKPPLCFDAIMAKARAWTARLIQARYGKKSGIPLMTHSEITARRLKSSDPAGRGALQNFERLMRHVALWEHACRGDIKLNNTAPASEDYDENNFLAGYDETPDYAWCDKFNWVEFENKVSGVAHNERDQFERNLEEFDVLDRYSKEPVPQVYKCKPSRLHRISLGRRLQDVVGQTGDFLVPIFLPEVIIDKCNDLILSALKDHNLPSSVPPLTPALKEEYMSQVEEAMEELGVEVFLPTLWHVDSIRAWQLIDRRIDEACEILQAFRIASAIMMAEEENRKYVFITQLSKRAIRSTPQDEFASFAGWVAHAPRPVGDEEMNGGWGDTDLYDRYGDEEW